MSLLSHYALSELKLVYSVLHPRLMELPALMDGNFVDDLQRHLQQAALTEGVDVTDHAQWAAWLLQP